MLLQLALFSGRFLSFISCSNAFLTIWMTEGLSGTRISETADGGQGHGLLAGDVRIVQLRDGTEMVDLLIRDWKTKRARFVSVPGTTASGLSHQGDTGRPRAWR